MIHFVARHLFERDDRLGARLPETFDHPSHNVALRVQSDDRIAERDDERLRANKGRGAQHGVTQAEQLALARVKVLNRRALEFEFC